MPTLLRPVAVIALLAVAACDETAVSSGGTSFAETRGINSCIRAVERETGIKGASHNTTLPVVEVDQFIINVPNAKPWTCYTNSNGRAEELVEIG